MGKLNLLKLNFMPPHWMMLGVGGGHIVFRYSIRGYVRTNVCPSVQMCICMYVLTYIRDPVTQVKAFVPGRILQFYSQVPHSRGIRVLWTHF